MPTATCPKCRQALNIPENAAGRLVRCPKCSAEIRVSGKSASVSAKPLPPPLPQSSQGQIQRREQSANLAECPFCRGEVPRDAIRCRHCGETLDPGTRADEEASREASLLAESTDVFGVVGFIISLFANLALLAMCCYGIGVVAIPLGMVGAGCSLFGRGNLRVAGLVLNGIAVFAGVIGGAVWIVWMLRRDGVIPP